MRTCKSCLVEKSLSEFKKHTHGHRHVCKKCQYKSMMENPFAHANAVKRNRKWRNSENGKATEMVYSQSEMGKKSRRESIKKYETSTGKAQKVARTVYRRLAKNQRTPKWLSEIDLWMIKEAYELAALRTKMFGFSWHVDHIIPLQGVTVSGLHVPKNLQVIPWLDNVRKHNRVNP
jgi:hypothetical protein